MTRPRWLAPLLGDARDLLVLLAVALLFAACVAGRVAVAVLEDVGEAWRRMTG